MAGEGMWNCYGNGEERRGRRMGQESIANANFTVFRHKFLCMVVEIIIWCWSSVRDCVLVGSNAEQAGKG